MKRWLNKLSSLSLLVAMGTFTVHPLMTPPASAQQTTPNIVIPLGQAITFNVPDGISTLAVGSSSIATATISPVNPKLAIITALKPGITNVLVWTNRSPNPINYVIEVSDNYRKEQIAVRVKVLEVEKTNDGKLGVDWSDSISFAEATPNAPFRFGLPVRNSVLNARIDTLVNNRQARVLAEPTLVLLNGKEGEFLSGGELPLIITDRDRINVQWREFGINMKVKARIEGADTIQLELKPEVSDIDRANSITIANQLQGGSFVVPAFKTRRAETTLQVQNNESIIIAGLLKNDKQEVIQKLPLLGDIPVLGWLFQTVDFQDRRSELVFIVTPSIVRDTNFKPEFNYAQEADVEKK